MPYSIQMEGICPSLLISVNQLANLSSWAYILWTGINRSRAIIFLSHTQVVSLPRLFDSILIWITRWEKFVVSPRCAQMISNTDNVTSSHVSSANNHTWINVPRKFNKYQIFRLAHSGLCQRPLYMRVHWSPNLVNVEMRSRDKIDISDFEYSPTKCAIWTRVCTWSWI